jgi:hypothetical protein
MPWLFWFLFSHPCKTVSSAVSLPAELIIKGQAGVFHLQTDSSVANAKMHPAPSE